MLMARSNPARHQVILTVEAFFGCRITELYRARTVQYQATAAAG
jgi:hypothetical protein